MTACCSASSCCDRNKAEPSVLVSDDPGSGSRPGSSSQKELNASAPFASPYALDSVVFRVQGMDCAGCATTVDNLIHFVPGVVQYTINFAISQLQVSFNPIITDQAKIATVLNNGGYKTSIASNTQAELLESLKRSEDSTLFRRRFLQSLFFSIPLFLITDIIPHFEPSSILEKRLRPGLFLDDLLAFLLTLPILWLSRRFYLSTWAALRSRTTNIDVLVTFGITAAAGYSTLAVLVAIYKHQNGRPETFFETAGELVTFILFGRWLESSCSGWTAGTLSSLVQLTPQVAIRLSADLETTVAVDQLQTGDQVINRPGSQFSADGIILDGSGEVDESMLTGDRLPILKKPGDCVIAGTINLNGVLRTRVEKTGPDTQLSQIIELMKDSQSSKAQLQMLADCIAAYFTPIILVLSVATFLVWLELDPTRYIHKGMLDYASYRVMLSLKLAIAVVVVCCPCALSVATPAAVMCGIGVGSTEGILIKGAKVFENLNQVTDFVFDKTGTLTRGDMTVSTTRMAPNYRSRDMERGLWQAIAAAEETLGRIHPISKALIDYARQFGDHTGVAVKNLKNIPGRGLVCTIKSTDLYWDSKTLVIGSRAFLHGCQIEVPTNTELMISGNECEGKTQVYFAIDSTSFAGTVLINDELKDDAKQTIEALQKLGRRTWMLTGDNSSAAARVAASVGIPLSRVLSDQAVADKVSFIGDLQSVGKRVAFVGDGINDAPALGLADVGISLTGSSAIALECADVILMRPRVLIDVVVAVVLSNDVFRRIKYNLTFAFAWNLIGVPFAMGILLPVGLYLPPALAGLLMALSCVCIVCSSLLLRTWKRPVHLLLPRDESAADLPTTSSRYTQIMRKMGWTRAKRSMEAEV